MENNKVITIDANASSYEVSKHNAMKHGILSKYTVMPWESKEEYENLIASLVQEYNPEGAMQEHLVEEIAGIMWRKMRLKYAEMTSTQEALCKYIQTVDYGGNSHAAAKAALLEESKGVKDFDIKSAVVATDQETQTELKEMKHYLACWTKAETLLSNGGTYEKALAALHKDDQETWKADWLGERMNNYSDKFYTPTAESLKYWISDNITYYKKQIYELESRAKIKHQLLGQAMITGDKLEKYTRYEIHLDRKLERTLSMLLKLQELHTKTV